MNFFSSIRSVKLQCILFIPLYSTSISIAATQDNLTMGNSAYSQQKYGKAIKYYEMVVKENSPTKQLYELYRKMGVSYLKIKKYKKSINTLNQALKYGLEKYSVKSKKIAYIHIAIGDAIAGLKLYREAHVHFKGAKNVFITLGESAHEELFNILSRIGDNYLNGNRYRAAEDAYIRALALLSKPKIRTHLRLAFTYSDLARTYWAMEDYKKSIVHYNKAIGFANNVKSINSHNINILKINLGYVYRASGDYTNAKNTWEGITINSSGSESLYNDISRMLKKLYASIKMGSNCTETKRKKYQVKNTLPVTLIKERDHIQCRSYIPGERGGASGPINSKKPYGQFFNYSHGRLYYYFCSNFMDKKDVKSFAFINWHNRDNTQQYRVQLRPLKNYCFLPGNFKIKGRKLDVILTECKQGMHGKLNIKKTVTYYWHGDKHGCGTFKY